MKKEIDEGRPIIVGVSPSGFKIKGISQHMALIVGYDDSSGDLKLTVNDPFPFEDDRFLWIANPYNRTWICQKKMTANMRPVSKDFAQG